MSVWEYSCHVEVYKWYLDDCQDDEEPLETSLTFLIYPLLHAVEKIGLWSSEYINQFMAGWSIDKEAAAPTGRPADPQVCSASSDLL